MGINRQRKKNKISKVKQAIDECVESSFLSHDDLMEIAKVLSKFDTLGIANKTSLVAIFEDFNVNQYHKYLQEKFISLVTELRTMLYLNGIGSEEYREIVTIYTNIANSDGLINDNIKNFYSNTHTSEHDDYITTIVILRLFLQYFIISCGNKLKRNTNEFTYIQQIGE